MKDRTEVLQPSAKKVRFPYIDFELLREFQPYVAGSKKETLCTIALITIGVIINIILPILIRDLTQKPDINLICRTALILVLLYIYHIVACIGHVKAAAQGRVLVEKLKTTALSRIHNMSFGDAVTQPAEILASLITQGSQCVGDHLSEALTDLYQSVLFFICFTIGLIYLSPQMCAILGIVALLNKLVTTSLSTDFSQKSNDLADKNSRALKHLINVLSLQSTVRLFHVQNQTETSYRGLLGETTRIGHEVDWQLHFSSGATFCINNTLYILLVVAARYLKDAGRLNDGDLFLFFFFVKRWLDHVGEIAKIISKLRGMQGSTETLRSILRTQYNPQNELVGKAVNEIAHSEIVLRATDLHFHYGAKGMTFELKAGRLYCMIGKSGEGKTTTMRLLSSLLELTRGKLERSEAVVLCEQDAGILTGTVHDNIAIGMSGDLPATRDDVQRAAKRAAFDLVAKDLPNGYDTMLRCEGEIPLSGGQLQRLCLSRAFMSNAKIMIFDEPTKGLDNAFATHVVNSLLQLRNEGRTILVVTHDLRIAERAEWIYLVHEGKIEGEGRHTELEQKSDMYRNMLHESCTS